MDGELTQETVDVCVSALDKVSGEIEYDAVTINILSTHPITSFYLIDLDDIYGNPLEIVDQENLTDLLVAQLIFTIDD
jgi:hypothetical protein